MASSSPNWSEIIPSFTCPACEITEVWLGVVPVRHLHRNFLLICNVCRAVLTTPGSTTYHFQTHAHPLHNLSPIPHCCPSPDFTPPPPYNSTETSPASAIPETQASPRDALPSPSQNALSPTPSRPLTPAQRAPSASSASTAGTPIPPGFSPMAEVARLRDLLQQATEHLTWLAAATSRLPTFSPNTPLGSFIDTAQAAFNAPPSNPDVDFRRRLAITFRTSLPDAEHASVSEIVRILLPVYEQWYALAHPPQP